MCELIGIDPDAFYERLGICELAIASDLHNFLEENPEYDRIEYMGELVSHEDLENIVNELFYDYLALYGLDGSVEDADAADDGEDQADDTSVDPERFQAGAIIFDAILEAAMDVDLEGKQSVGTEFPEDGHVLSLLEDVMTEISEIRSEEDLGDEETLSQALYGLTSLGEDDEISEEELDDLLGLMLLAGETKSAEMESEEVDIPSYFMVVGDFADFVVKTVEDNEVIAEAVGATDSSLFEILESFTDENKETVDDRDALFEELEVELEKVTDHINTMEGPKQAALDLLDLVHTIADELHAFYYGHTHEIAEEAE